MFTLAAYTQHFDPVGNSLFASAVVASLPLITLFVTLGGLRFTVVHGTGAADFPEKPLNLDPLPAVEIKP